MHGAAPTTLPRRRRLPTAAARLGIAAPRRLAPLKPAREPAPCGADEGAMKRGMVLSCIDDSPTLLPNDHYYHYSPERNSRRRVAPLTEPVTVQLTLYNRAASAASIYSNATKLDGRHPLHGRRQARASGVSLSSISDSSVDDGKFSCREAQADASTLLPLSLSRRRLRRADQSQNAMRL